MDRMAAPGGYNPAVSLLPAASGTIHAMSGGSYNPQASLLPSVTGAITGYRGGGGEDLVSTTITPSDASQSTTSAPAITPLGMPKGKPATNPSQIDAVIARQDTNRKAMINAMAKAKPSTNKPIESVVAAAAVAALTDAIEEKEEKDENQTPEKPGQLKTIILFQQSLTLRDPRQFIDKEDRFVVSDDEKKALDLFGVGQIKDIKHKLEILQGIYDGECNDNTTLTQEGSCKPIRRIVRTLMDRYLKGLVKEQMNLGKGVPPTPPTPPPTPTPTPPLPAPVTKTPPVGSEPQDQSIIAEIAATATMNVINSDGLPAIDDETIARIAAIAVVAVEDNSGDEDDDDDDDDKKKNCTEAEAAAAAAAKEANEAKKEAEVAKTEKVTAETAAADAAAKLTEAQENNTQLQTDLEEARQALAKALQALEEARIAKQANNNAAATAAVAATAAAETAATEAAERVRALEQQKIDAEKRVAVAEEAADAAKNAAAAATERAERADAERTVAIQARTNANAAKHAAEDARQAAEAARQAAEAARQAAETAKKEAENALDNLRAASAANKEEAERVAKQKQALAEAANRRAEAAEAASEDANRRAEEMKQNRNKHAAQADALEKEVNTLKAQLAHAQKAEENCITASTGEKARLETNIASIKQQLEQSKQNLRTAQNEHLEALHVKSNDNETLKQELDKLQQQIHDQTTLTDRSAAAAEEAKTALKNALQQGTTKNATIAQLQENITRRNKETSDCQAKLERLKEEHAKALQDKDAAHKTELDILKAREESLKTALELGIENALHDIRSYIKNAKGKIISIMEERTDPVVIASNKPIPEQIDEIVDYIHGMKKGIDVYVTGVSKRATDAEKELVTTLDEFATKIKEETDKVQEAEQRVADAEGTIDGLEGTIKELQLENTSLEVVLENLHDVYNELIQSKYKTIHNLQTAKNESNKQSKNKNTRIAALEKELAAIHQVESERQQAAADAEQKRLAKMEAAKVEAKKQAEEAKSLAEEATRFAEEATRLANETNDTGVKDAAKNARVHAKVATESATLAMNNNETNAILALSYAKSSKEQADKAIEFAKDAIDKANAAKAAAEQKRQAAAPEEQQRLAAEAEQQRLAAEAEQQRLAAEAEQQRLAAEAAAAQLTDADRQRIKEQDTEINAKNTRIITLNAEIDKSLADFSKALSAVKGAKEALTSGVLKGIQQIIINGKSPYAKLTYDELQTYSTVKLISIYNKLTARGYKSHIAHLIIHKEIAPIRENHTQIIDGKTQVYEKAKTAENYNPLNISLQNYIDELTQLKDLNISSIEKKYNANSKRQNASRKNEAQRKADKDTEKALKAAQAEQYRTEAQKGKEARLAQEELDKQKAKLERNKRNQTKKNKNNKAKAAEMAIAEKKRLANEQAARLKLQQNTEASRKQLEDTKKREAEKRVQNHRLQQEQLLQNISTKVQNIATKKTEYLSKLANDASTYNDLKPKLNDYKKAVENYKELYTKLNRNKQSPFPKISNLDNNVHTKSTHLTITKNPQTQVKSHSPTPLIPSKPLMGPSIAARFAQTGKKGGRRTHKIKTHRKRITQRQR